MPELLLARHAKSDWPYGVDDHERPLAERGLRDAKALGEWLGANAAAIDRVIISTARRTRETWAIASQELADMPPYEFTDEIYEAEWGSLLDVARRGGSAQRLLLIGHNPGMEELAAALAGESLQHHALTEKFPTSAIARLSFAGEWSALTPGAGELIEFVIPRG